MTQKKLTDTQLVLLTTACQRAEGSLLPPPASLGDQLARIRRAVSSLIKGGLAAEHEVSEPAKRWREEDGRLFGVIVTAAGRTAIGVADEDIGDASAPTIDAAAMDDTGGGAADTVAAKTPKHTLVLDLLKRDSGATINQLTEATGWLPHTTRAALTGLRKKGHKVLTQKFEGTTRYRIAGAA